MPPRFLPFLILAFLIHQFLPAQQVPIPRQGRNGKWGYADAGGKWLVRPRYEKVDSASEGFLSVTKKAGKHRYLDLEGKRAFGRLKFGNARPFRNGMAAVKDDYHGDWGFIDTTGILVVDYDYESVKDFDRYGFALCSLSSSKKHFLIDKSGNNVVMDIVEMGPYDERGRSMLKVDFTGNQAGYQYFSGPERKTITEAYTASFELGAARQLVRQYGRDSRTGFIGPEGTPISKFYSELKSIPGGKYIAQLPSERTYIPYYGILNGDLDELIPVRYGRIEDKPRFIVVHDFERESAFSILNYDLDTVSGPFRSYEFTKLDSFHVVKLFGRNNSVLLGADGRVLHKGFEKIIPAGEGKYKLIKAASTDDVAAMQAMYGSSYLENERQYAYLDRTGAILGPWYSILDLNSRKIPPARSFWQALGDMFVDVLLTISGVYIIDAIFNKGRMRSSGYVEESNEFEGGDFVEGKAVVGFTGPRKEKWEGNDGYYYNANTFSYINSTGKLITKSRFELAMDFSEGLGAVKNKGKFGYVDDKGKLVIPCTFEDVDAFKEGLAPAKTSKKYGFINQKGKMVIPATLDYAWPFSEGLAAAQKGNLWGFLDHQGKWVIEPKYMEVTSFAWGKATVKDSVSSVVIENPIGK